MPWYVYALIAATIWGVHYLLLSRVLTTVTPLTAYWMPTTIMMLGLPFFYQTLWTDFKKVLVAEPIVQLSTVLITFTSFAATIALYKAIQSHNPVHASLIEITFPLFIATFALVLFNENHFTWSTVTGGLLIMAGSGLIIYSNG